MSAGCNTCYLAATQPEWVARIVTNMREDKPCERHREGGSNGVSEYTPTTEEVRQQYVFSDSVIDGTSFEDPAQGEAEFDRWLAEVKAEQDKATTNRIIALLEAWLNDDYGDFNATLALIKGDN